MSPRAAQWAGGLAALVAGLVVCLLVYRHPEGLNAPAWVAYAAGSAFVLAGLAMLAAALDATQLQGVLGLAIVVCLLAIAAWVVFGPGERACPMSFTLLHADIGDALCRGAFGLGALLVVLFLALLGRRMLRAQAKR